MGTAQRGLFIDYTIAMLEAAVNGLNTCTFFYDGKKEVGGGGEVQFLLLRFHPRLKYPSTL